MKTNKEKVIEIVANVLIGVTPIHMDEFRIDIANELTRDELIDRLCETTQLYRDLRDQYLELPDQSSGEEVSNKCKCEEDYGWTTVMACNRCGFIVDPVWPEKKLTLPKMPTEGEIKEALSKYEKVITEFLTGIGVDAGEANNAREDFIKELLNQTL